jgi:hypothetical protein
MIVRIEKNAFWRLKKHSKYCFILSAISFVMSLICVLLIELFEKIQIVFAVLIILFFIISAILLIRGCWVLKQIELEDNYLKLEKYCEDNDNLLAKLYKLYLKNEIDDFLNKEFNDFECYPFLLNEEFQFVFKDAAKETNIGVFQSDISIMIGFEVYEPNTRNLISQSFNPIEVSDDCSLEELLEILKKIVNNE